MNKSHLKHAKTLLSKGGPFWLMLIVARITRLPIGTLLSLLPFLLEQLRKDEAQRPADNRMTRDEARLILGVPVGASKSEIVEAHRRLIQKNHPDLGGTDYLAAKINEARDILLN